MKMKSKSNSNKANTAVLYGGLQYDLETTAMAEESKKYDLSNLLALRGEIARGDSVFHNLQGTKEEILKIEDLLKEINGKSLRIWAKRHRRVFPKYARQIA